MRLTRDSGEVTGDSVVWKSTILALFWGRVYEEITNEVSSAYNLRDCTNANRL